MRRLLCTTRQVALDRSDDYLPAWDSVRLAVERAGGRAWLFRGADHEDRFLEFIEWDDAQTTPLEDEAVTAAVENLDTFASPLAAGEWEEASEA
ncbi:MAG TPA: hypothetical protein VK929_07715 [Longimicrobiales bacterium]|nr:hypothetical protein [Longimicrobiales bacterium]